MKNTEKIISAFCKCTFTLLLVFFLSCRQKRNLDGLLTATPNLHQETIRKNFGSPDTIINEVFSMWSYSLSKDCTARLYFTENGYLYAVYKCDSDGNKEKVFDSFDPEMISSGSLRNISFCMQQKDFFVMYGFPDVFLHNCNNTVQYTISSSLTFEIEFDEGKYLYAAYELSDNKRTVLYHRRELSQADLENALSDQCIAFREAVRLFGYPARTTGSGQLIWEYDLDNSNIAQFHFKNHGVLQLIRIGPVSKAPVFF